MQAFSKEQEKILHQTAVREASRGKGSAFFNLLVPISILVPFLALYAGPLMLMHLLELEPYWLDKYSFLSPPMIAVAACTLYGYLRHRRLKPVIERLRSELKNTEHSA